MSETTSAGAGERAPTPKHLWIVGVIALLWNTMGVVDYLATQLEVEAYLANFTPEQLDYFTSFPAWMTAAWAIAVWSGWVAAIGLLLRKAWSAILFAVAVVGLAVSTLYNFVLSDGAAIMGTPAVIFTGVIWIIAISLVVYARRLAKSGVLT